MANLGFHSFFLVPAFFFVFSLRTKITKLPLPIEIPLESPICWGPTGTFMDFSRESFSWL